MSADNWFAVAIVGFILAGIALLAVIFIFFKMRIPAVIGDLTGRTIAREIRAIREKNNAVDTLAHSMSTIPLKGYKETEILNEYFKIIRSTVEIHTDETIERGLGHEQFKK